MKTHEENLEILKNNLYENYSRKEISDKLECSITHVSRLLNNKSKMNIEQFFKLQEMIR